MIKTKVIKRTIYGIVYGGMNLFNALSNLMNININPPFP